MANYETTGDPGERLYRWTIRGVYLVAVGLNLWFLWEQIKGTPEGEAMSSKAEELKAKALSPITNRRIFRRHANELIYEAVTVVENAQEEPDD